MTIEVASAMPAVPIIFERTILKLIFKATQMALIMRGVTVFLNE